MKAVYFWLVFLIPKVYPPRKEDRSQGYGKETPLGVSFLSGRWLQLIGTDWVEEEETNPGERKKRKER